MTPALRWMFGVLGLLVLAISPWLWWVAPGLLWVAVPGVGAWGIWLVSLYLTWGRTLRQR